MDFVIPENLYVPTPPLWIESKGFNGPLDLLWYLIRQQNIDILDIPVALIAAQYVQYISIMTNDDIRSIVKNYGYDTDQIEELLEKSKR